MCVRPSPPISRTPSSSGPRWGRSDPSRPRAPAFRAGGRAGDGGRGVCRRDGGATLPRPGSSKTRDRDPGHGLPAGRAHRHAGRHGALGQPGYRAAHRDRLRKTGLGHRHAESGGERPGGPPRCRYGALRLPAPPHHARDADRSMTGRSRPPAKVIHMKRLGLLLGLTIAAACDGTPTSDGDGDRLRPLDPVLVAQGKDIFRHDTYGNEVFWTDTARMHEVIASAVSPRVALSVGLKVDADALPQAVQDAIAAGQVDLDDPATTVTLLKLHSVVGLHGTVESIGGKDSLVRVGIQCALCHSQVDNSFAPGIGNRLDGWANRDLNIGAIVALAPRLEPFTDLLGVDVPTVRAVLNSWGPGKFDAQLLLDGKAFRPDGRSAATLIPPAFGLAGVNNHTWTGSWGTVSYWNAFVANLEMHGKGVFFDPRLDDSQQFPIAAAARLGHQRDPPDLITPRLPALHAYQLPIPAPRPRAGSFNATAAARGQAVFNGKASCDSCYVAPLFTEPGWNLHTSQEIGIDAFQADRSPDRRYRTAPLRGLWTHQKGGFYHDGRFPTLPAVVDHYDSFFTLGLSAQEKNDLVQYLLSL